MPITLNPIGDGVHLGWGDNIVPHTTFIGPLPSGSFWLINFFSDPDRTKGVFSISRPWVNNDPQIQLTIHNSSIGFEISSVADGQTIFWDAQLWQGGTTLVDESNGSLTWTTTSNFYPALLQSIPLAGTGLSSAQAAQLTQIVDNTTTTKENASGTTQWSVGEALGAQSIDTFTALEITSGPTSGFVSHNLTAFVWGVLVRISTLAPIDVPITPDGDYFIRDLAVVRIFHGDDLYLRKPIHTSSQIVDLRQDKLSLIVTAVEVALWPNSVTLQVNFAAGISGQVFLLTLP